MLGNIDLSGPSNLTYMNQKQTLTSPIQRKISRSAAKDTIPFYRGEETDDNGERFDCYEPILKPVVISITKAKLFEVVDFALDENSELKQPAFKRSTSRSDFITCLFRDHVPDHFALSYDCSHIYTISSVVEQYKNRRGGKKKSHQYLIRWWGTCQAAKYGCILQLGKWVSRRMNLCTLCHQQTIVHIQFNSKLLVRVGILMAVLLESAPSQQDRN